MVAAVIILSFLLLLAVFRSVLVAIKAGIMNLLSIGAAYGVIVAIFQWGWLSDVVGIGRPGPIEFWVPMMLFTVLFGLSMDYEVFLLSRVREEYLVSGDNATAVADGLASTARVITAAAAIMIAVFMSFVLGDLRVLKLLGLGLATAIFIDATIVRMVLVPATMELLGKANWWMPDVARPHRPAHQRRSAARSPAPWRDLRRTRTRRARALLTGTDVHPRHSLAMAVRMSSRAARRAGRMPASVPASAPTTRKTASCAGGTEKTVIVPLDDASTSPHPRNVPSAMPPTVPNVAMITDSHRTIDRA